MDSKEFLKDLQSGIKPDIQTFKIGPEQIAKTVEKICVFMGGTPADISNIKVENEKKNVSIIATISRHSDIFAAEKADDGLTLWGGSGEPKAKMSKYARDVLETLGFAYHSNEDNKTVKLYNVTEGKKKFEIQFNTEVMMAIITNCNYSDTNFIVDAVEEVVHKRKYDKKKYKGKKQTIIFTKVEASAGNAPYNPSQVSLWHNKSLDSNDD